MVAENTAISAQYDLPTADSALLPPSNVVTDIATVVTPVDVSHGGSAAGSDGPSAAVIDAPVNGGAVVSVSDGAVVSVSEGAIVLP